MTEAGLLQAPAGSQRRRPGRPEATPSPFSTIRPLGGGWHDAFLNRGLRFEAEQAMCGGRVDPGSKKQGTAWEHLITLLAKWTPPLIIDVHLVLAFYTPCLGDDSIRRNPEIKDGATCDACALMAPPTWSCIKKKRNKKSQEFPIRVWKGGAAVRTAASQQEEFACSPPRRFGFTLKEYIHLFIISYMAASNA